MAIAVRRDARGRVIVPPRPLGMRRRALRQPIHTMVSDLSREHGKCFATEAGLRRELYRRTGYVCGQRSISRAIKRSVGRGELGQERVAPYARRVDGDRNHPGTTHTWVIVRREQRKASRRQQRRESARIAKRARELVTESACNDETPADSFTSAAHIRTALAAIRHVELPALSGAQQSDEKPTRAHPASIEEQIRELQRLGFDLPPKKPPDE